LFFNQPLAMRFGHGFVEILKDSSWKNLDMAVAWVRASGVAHIDSQLRTFLSKGGELNAIVGIDLLNTTKEGLEALLDLETVGNAKIYVHHNEASTTFHPKVYLFRNAKTARLIVGSNNLTESGLFSNVEAGLSVSLKHNDQVVLDALDAMASWRDMAGGLVKRLDADLLTKLFDQGYVPSEVGASWVPKNPSPRSGVKKQKLFGSRSFSAPPRKKLPKAPPSAPTTSSIPAATVALPTSGGGALLMRIRKAAAGRPTQTQIPIRLFKTGFFGSSGEVVSAHSNMRKEIHEARSGGSGPNTLKLEIPEMRHFSDPVIRFQQVGTDLVYETYDVGTPQGNQIMAALKAGQSSGETELTVPAKPKEATWWRFI
jgi:hypothetical protein